MTTQLKRLALAAGLLSILNPLLSTCLAQGTAFTYQGRLNSSGTPVNGPTDFEFRLYDALAQVGLPVTVDDVGVTNGLFTVSLTFGSAVFDGGARFLEIAVRPGASSGPYTTLTPRQRINATPYAITAGAVSGPVSLSQLPSEVLTVNASREILGPVRAIDPGNVFVGDGSGLKDVAADSIGPANQLQYQSTFFRKLSTASVPNWAVGHYGAGGAVVGDFNGDGRPDILMSLAGIGVSALYTNAGDGNVRMAGEVSFYFFPRAVAVGDFNGDGSLDVAGGDLRNNVIVVLTNRSNGTFVSMASVPATNVTALVAADINSDGKKDLVVSTAGSPARMRTFLSSGSGFVASGTLDLPSDATDLAAGDLDGDSRTDIVAACVSAGKLAIFRNPAGALVAGPLLDAERPWAVAIGRFDFGATPDLVYLSGHDPATFGTEDWNVRFLIQTGALAFQPAGAPYKLIRPNYISSSYGARLIVADFNNDGWNDVIAGYGFFSQERMALLTNPGGDVPRVAVEWTNPGIVDFGVADFNGDTQLDLGTAVWTQGATGAAAWLRAYDGINVNAFSQFMGEATFNGGLTADRLNVTGPATFLGDVQGALSFGASTRQMLNLWSTSYGVGVQPGTLYFRANNGSVNDGFAWFKGGSHVDNVSDPGPGGTKLMSLTSSGLVVSGTGNGVQGTSSNPSASGVHGENTGQGFGVAGRTTGTGSAVFGDNANSSGWAGNFNGRVFASGNLFFGTGALRQMLDLWNGEHAIGVQAWTTYFRTIGAPANGAFAWYKGGVHNDNYLNAGGGEELMRLTSSGLTVRGTFVSASDRNAKDGFEPVDARTVLEKVAALPVTRWHYTNDNTTAHIGPMAQDFHAAFGLGVDNKTIATVDADGVALAAIQGLNLKVEEQRAENAALKQRLAELEQLVHTLTKKGN